MAIVKFNVRAGLLGSVVATAALSSQQSDAPDVLVADALSLRSMMIGTQRPWARAHAWPSHFLTKPASAPSDSSVQTDNLGSYFDLFPQPQLIEDQGVEGRRRMSGVSQLWTPVFAMPMLPITQEEQEDPSLRARAGGPHQIGSTARSQASDPNSSLSGSTIASLTTSPSQIASRLGLTSEQPTLGYRHERVRPTDVSSHSDRAQVALRLGSSLWSRMLPRASLRASSMPGADEQVWQTAELNQVMNDEDDDDIPQWIKDESVRTYKSMAEFDALWNKKFVEATAGLEGLLEDWDYERLEKIRLEAKNAWRDDDQELARGLMESMLHDHELQELREASELSKNERAKELRKIWREQTRYGHQWWSPSASSLHEHAHLATSTSPVVEDRPAIASAAREFPRPGTLQGAAWTRVQRSRHLSSVDVGVGETDFVSAQSGGVSVEDESLNLGGSDSDEGQPALVSTPLLRTSLSSTADPFNYSRTGAGVASWTRHPSSSSSFLRRGTRVRFGPTSRMAAHGYDRRNQFSQQLDDHLTA